MRAYADHKRYDLYRCRLKGQGEDHPRRGGADGPGGQAGRSGRLHPGGVQAGGRDLHKPGWWYRHAPCPHGTCKGGGPGLPALEGWGAVGGRERPGEDHLWYRRAGKRRGYALEDLGQLGQETDLRGV